MRTPEKRRRDADWIGALVPALVAALLIAPLFTIEYLDNWGSIDSTFIADSRFLAEHWPGPLWQPLWYCGTRFAYVYPPALRYGTAGLAKLSGMSTAHAYHIYTALLYCIGIAGVYLLARTLGLRRMWAGIAAIGTAALSPSFLIMASYRHDAALHMPQRLNVLIKWGEGPHMSALALLPFALLFTWRALERGRGRTIAAAGALCSLVVAHNFYGAVALAISFGLAVWSVWVANRDWRIFGRAALIVLLAYGLAAWWLTPSYLTVTVENLKLVAQPGNAWSRWTAAGALAAFGWITWRLAASKKATAPGVFLAGAALLFGLIPIGHYYAGFRVVGEPHRLVPEFDLFAIVGMAAALERLAARGGAWARIAAYAAVAVAFGAAYPYLARPWSVFVRDTHFQDRVEHRLSDWIARHMPDGRVFVTGSLRFWYDAWRDNAQVGGGSDQGLMNGAVPIAQWHIIRDPTAERSALWLQALGADALVVHRAPSRVVFLEYAAPEKFAGVLPVIFDDGVGDVIYGTSRRFAARARVVRTAELERLRPIPMSDDIGELEAYVRAVEHGPDREVALRRDGPDTMTLRARLEAGESVLVQETYDPAWHAYSAGHALRVTKDAAGFLVLHAPPGEREIRLVFERPLENRIGGAVTLIAAIAAVLLAWKRREA